ncbi:Hcp family type VI secretion system effector [Rhizobium halophytocola]|uniref:Type VI secretion system secreted protein Hcp n=1 Tax=Rhizobium halophytocola TaxID=735519 RepID=A0ABS4E3F8_9HYPH|nr:type VI secretion system tube protein Hcp [Rhizobium halophytocola]MBP1852481.1 type VI secretion system secreted protein Hcp [Rhizobium halophytocola]
MAFDAFLYFPGSSLVAGETQDEEMSKLKAFELKDFSFGAENTINIGSDSGGGGAGKAIFKDFEITKRTDTASCGLFLTLCSGTHFDEAIIELRRSGGQIGVSGRTFMKFYFKQVMVKDLSWSGSDGDDVCEEKVILVYGAIKVEYNKQDSTGKMTKASGGQGEVKWSRVKNKAIYDV